MFGRLRHVLAALIAIAWIVICLVVLEQTCIHVHSQRKLNQAASQYDKADRQESTSNARGDALTRDADTGANQPDRSTAPQNNLSASRCFMDNNTLMSFFTFVIACVGGLTWWTYRQIRDHTKVVERAYLALSTHPPGIQIDPLVLTGPGDAQQNVWVYVGVKNLGNTPANITYSIVQLFITNQPLPELPPYDESLLKRMYVSVVKTDRITIFQNHPMTLFSLDQLRAPETVLKLYVLGYVDYIDKFGSRHRCGYARVFNPSAEDRNSYLNDDGTFNEKASKKRNNLVFVTQPNYNYDRERKKGEGDDWNEPAKQPPPGNSLS